MQPHNHHQQHQQQASSMARGDNQRRHSKPPPPPPPQSARQLGGGGANAAATTACRELCASCRSRVDAVLADGGGGGVNRRRTGDNKDEDEEGEFRLFQTSMPDHAVAEVKRKLAELALNNPKAEEAELGQELSRFLEGRFSGAWNVIVGEDFAASVIYGAKSFLHCGFGGLSYLLFSWQPAGLFASPWAGASADRPY